VTPDEEPVIDRDRSYIRQAVSRAKRKNPALSGLVFDFVQDILLKQASCRHERERRDQLRFAMKFQQITARSWRRGRRHRLLRV